MNAAAAPFTLLSPTTGAAALISIFTSFQTYHIDIIKAPLSAAHSFVILSILHLSISVSVGLSLSPLSPYLSRSLSADLKGPLFESGECLGFGFHPSDRNLLEPLLIHNERVGHFFIYLIVLPFFIQGDGSEQGWACEFGKFDCSFHE